MAFLLVFRFNLFISHFQFPVSQIMATLLGNCAWVLNFWVFLYLKKW